MLLLPQLSFRLRAKFSLLILIILFLIFAASTSFLIKRNIDAQTQDLISQARSFAQLSAKPIGSAYQLYYQSGYLKFQELTKKILALNPDIGKVQAVSATGEILFDSEELLPDKRQFPKSQIIDETVLKSVKANTISEIPPKTVNSKPNQIIVPYFEDFGAHPFSIRYFISYEAISKNLINTVLTTLLLSLVFFAIAVFLIISAVNKIILNPIEVVISGAKRISSGDLTHTIVVKTQDEVEDLALAVNQMAQTLRKNIEDLKKLDELKDEFVIIVSHNLRTPLTILKSYLAIARKEGARFAGQEVLEEKVVELEELVEKLVSIVSLGTEKEYLIEEEVDLANLLKEVWSDFEVKAKEKNISSLWEIDETKSFVLKTDGRKLRKSLENIIDNAIKFNRQNGKVVIGLKDKKDVFIVSIADTGIGISPKYAEKIFEKFHRGTPSLQYDYPGVGLGLYVTKLIIEYLRGSIWFKSKEGEGTTFFVKLPKN